jgi:hypothetical protein
VVGLPKFVNKKGIKNHKFSSSNATEKNNKFMGYFLLALEQWKQP